MVRRWVIPSVAVFSIFTILGLAVWGIDRSETIKWVGATHLTIDFLVTDANTDQPIPDTRLEIHSEGGFWDGGEEVKTFELRTDAAGTARYECRNNRCIGTVSRLRFTDFYNVYIPRLQVRASAAGYEPSPQIDLKEDYRGKVQHEGPERDRLVVKVSLQKAAAVE